MLKTYSRYKIEPILVSNDNNVPIHDVNTQSKMNFNPSTSKFQTIFKPNIFWIALAIVLLIGLTLLVVLPIILLANKGEVTTTTKSTICPTTSITTTVTSSTLPAQCFNYRPINDDYTRSPDYTGSAPCDNTEFTIIPEWIRFTGSGGTLLANCPIEMFKCGADASGWYTGIYPSMAGDTTSGMICFSFLFDYCYWTNLTLVTNCNGFYVFYLREPPDCNLRYCTI